MEGAGRCAVWCYEYSRRMTMEIFKEYCDVNPRGLFFIRIKKKPVK